MTSTRAIDHGVGSTPIWDACEDCLGTGNRGECGSCGGRGRLPGNAAADAIAAREEREFHLRIEAQVQREIDDETGMHDRDYDEE